MPDHQKLLLGTIIFLLVIANAYGLALLSEFLNRLKRLHAETWARMGRPRIVNPENAQNANHLFSFIVTGQFRGLGDEKLTKLGLQMQFVLAISIMSLVAAFFVLQE